MQSALSPTDLMPSASIHSLLSATSVVPRMHWRRDPADLQQVLLLIAELDHLSRTGSFRADL